MAFFAFFGSLFIACVVGYIAEKSGFMHNGYVPSIIICIGGTVAFFMLRVMFGVSFGGPGVNAIVSSIGALVIVPWHWRR
jgi:uncharacterized membrane protein YeaQ/YmgE (transglycosylase-associated protein family)